jgi:putative ABC transport system substrate-binding protein
MRRRRFITLLGGVAAAWPLLAQAQKTDRLARIGVLMGYAETDSEAKILLGEFVHALSEFGWIEHQNLRMMFVGHLQRPI